MTIVPTTVTVATLEAGQMKAGAVRPAQAQETQATSASSARSSIIHAGLAGPRTESTTLRVRQAAAVQRTIRTRLHITPTRTPSGLARGTVRDLAVIALNGTRASLAAGLTDASYALHGPVPIPTT